MATVFQIDNNNDMCILSILKARGFGESDDALWRKVKFGLSGTTVAVGAGGTGATGAIGVQWQYATTGLGIFQGIDSYMRWDTSSLSDSEEITGVQLGLYVRDTVSQTFSGFSGTPSLLIYAGLTGGSDRPDFSAPVSGTDDKNFYCEDSGGCSSASCNANAGATLVGTIALSALSSGTSGSPTLNTITLNAGTDSGGSATLFNEWVNRTGYTYLYITTNLAYDTSSSTVCSNANDTKLVNMSSTSLMSTQWYSWGAAGGGTSDFSRAPLLNVSADATKKFQMII